MSPSSIAPTPSSFSSGRPSASPQHSDINFRQPIASPVDRISQLDNSDHSDHSDQNVKPSAPQTTPSLAHSLALLSRKLHTLSRTPKSKPAVKPRTPDVFDGSDPSKLDTFIFQCSIYLAACAEDFSDHTSRVAFMLSYLLDTPLDWFQSELSHAISHGGTLPPWYSSLPKFLAELRRLFGPHNAIDDATTALESLEYRDAGKATRYTLDFNRYSRYTGWNNQALARYYYKGLPDRLKDEIARIGKPAGLADLQDLVATLDQRYWERCSEISYHDDLSTHSRSSSASPIPSENSSDTSDSHDTHYSDAEEYLSSGDDAPEGTPPAVTLPASPSDRIADIIVLDGTLEPEDISGNIANGPCLRCDDPGHFIDGCPL